jgi:hypothetical protein
MSSHAFRAVATSLLATCVLSSIARADSPPRVVEMSPKNRAADVDAKTTKQISVTFDRAMSTTGWSFCGGGPNFPKTKGTPKWKDAKTIIFEVELEPDHQYSLSLNCPAAQNFKSATGVALSPTPWSFSTLPDKLPNPEVQRARNKKALDELSKILPAHYSYYDLRVKDWPKLMKEHTPAMLDAKTDVEWASAAAELLTPTQDIHLAVRMGERYFPTGSRAVDPLFREKLLAKYLTVDGQGQGFISGRTKDGIGYLMIGSWTSDVDLDQVEQAITKLQDTKAMVVDARPNCGGGEDLAQRIAAWFVEGTKVYAKDRIRNGPGKNGFSKILDRQIQGNDDEKRTYRKPISVLTSRYVMSSNESFVMMMQQAKDCVTIGQPTYGCSGNPKPFELSNGVTIVLPSWQDLRLDGTCFEGEGLAPDIVVEVETSDLEKRDPILEKALETLRAR